METKTLTIKQALFALRTADAWECVRFASHPSREVQKRATFKLRCFEGHMRAIAAAKGKITPEERNALARALELLQPDSQEQARVLLGVGASRVRAGFEALNAINAAREARRG